MFEAIVATVVGGLLLAGILWSLGKRDRLHDWWSRKMLEADELAQLAEAEQVETLRDQVAVRARQLGIRLPRSASGRRVTYTDGQTTTFIPNFQAYRAAMKSGRVDIHRTVNATPPIPLSDRDRGWLEEWLSDHPLG